MDPTKSPELNHTTLIREASHLASFASTAEIEKLPFAVLRKMEAVLVTILNLVNFEEAARASSLVLLPLSTSVTSAQSPQAQHGKVAESVKDLLRSLHVLEKFGERGFDSSNCEGRGMLITPNRRAS